MTKDEAIAAIIDSRNRMKTWATYVSEVREIIDQIDQPGEFRVRELVELICETNWVEIYGNHTWTICKCGESREVIGMGIDALRAKLLELAKPPEDPEVMVPMRLSLVKCCAERLDGDIKLACKAALEKAKL